MDVLLDEVMGAWTDAASVLLVVLALSAAFGLWRRMSDGRVKEKESREVLSAADLGAPLGEQATFVQFSSAFCQPCRATRVILENVAAQRPGVSHIEIDAEANLELVRRLDIMRTPTVLVLDAGGSIRGKASGVPRKDQVLRTLDSL